MTRLLRFLTTGETFLTRWFKRLICLGVALFAVLVVVRAVAIGRADGELRATVDALDAADPRWRIGDIVADRPPLADEDNSVTVIARAGGMLPKDWSLVEAPTGRFPRFPDLPDDEEGEDAPRPRPVANPSRTLPPGVGLRHREGVELEPDGPQVGDGVGPDRVRFAPPARDVRDRFLRIPGDEPLPRELLAGIETVRPRYLPALAELRAVLPLDRGRHPITLTPDVLGTLLPTADSARAMLGVLQMETWRDIDRDRPAAAAGHIRAMLQLARSFDSEPFAMEFDLRITCGSIALRAAERLCHGRTPSRADLLALEALFAREERELEAHFFRAVRGERGVAFEEVEALRSGALAIRKVLGPWRARPNVTVGVDEADAAAAPLLHSVAQTAILRRMGEMLRVNDLPLPERVAALERIEARIRRDARDDLVPGLAIAIVPDLSAVAGLAVRHVARLRCCRAGLLAEAFRLHNGRLPASVEGLCASLKVPIPLDPWDDKPLKWKPDGEGVSIYSIGKDGIDDGGERHPENLDAAGYDLVFRIPLSRKSQP